MDRDDFSNINDFINYCKNNMNFGNTEGFSDTEGCEDIPGGFQSLNPMLVVAVGELIGNIMAGNMPFNVQNIVGNWLMLVGQAIITFNAQQQYFQTGPGRYFNPKNFNIVNPFCGERPQGTSEGASSVSINRDNTSNKSGNNKSNNYHNMEKEIRNLQSQIDELKDLVNKLQNR